MPKQSYGFWDPISPFFGLLFGTKYFLIRSVPHGYMHVIEIILKNSAGPFGMIDKINNRG